MKRNERIILLILGLLVISCFGVNAFEINYYQVSSAVDFRGTPVENSLNPELDGFFYLTNSPVSIIYVLDIGVPSDFELSVWKDGELYEDDVVWVSDNSPWNGGVLFNWYKSNEAGERNVCIGIDDELQCVTFDVQNPEDLSDINRVNAPVSNFAVFEAPDATGYPFSYDACWLAPNPAACTEGDYPPNEGLANTEYGGKFYFFSPELPDEDWLPIEGNLDVSVFNDGVLYENDNVEIIVQRYMPNYRVVFNWEVGPDAGMRTLCVNVDGAIEPVRCEEFEIRQNDLPKIEDVIVQRNGRVIDHGMIGDVLDVYVAFDEVPENFWELDAEVFLRRFLDSEDDISVVSVTPGVGGVVVLEWEVSNLAGERTIRFSNVQLEDRDFVFDINSRLDEFFGAIGDINVFVGYDESSLRVEGFDLDNTGLQYYVDGVDPSDYGIEFQIDIDGFLDGVRYDVEINPGDSYPTYNEFQLSGVAENVVGALLMYYGYDDITVSLINADPALYINRLIDDFLGEYIGDEVAPFGARVEKEEESYYFYAQKGYTDAKAEGFKDAILEIIEDNLRYVDPQEIVDLAMPYMDLSEYIDFMGQYELGVDLGELDNLESGTYEVIILYTDSFGNEGERDATLTLEVPLMDSGYPMGGLYEPTNPLVADRLRYVVGLNDNWHVGVELYGVDTPSKWSIGVNPIDEVYEYFDIDIPDAVSPGTYYIIFRLSKVELGAVAPEDIRFYVYENGAWTELSTTLTKETAEHIEFLGMTEHFSSFSLGYDSTPDEDPEDPPVDDPDDGNDDGGRDTSSGSSGGRRDGGVIDITGEGSEGENTEGLNLNAGEENLGVDENNRGDQITGAAVAEGGVSDVVWPVVIVLVILGIIGLVIVMLRKRR